MQMPSQPSSAMALWKSCGNSPLRSRCSQYSESKREQTRATPSRIASCSGVRAKCMGPFRRVMVEVRLVQADRQLVREGPEAGDLGREEGGVLRGRAGDG